MDRINDSGMIKVCIPYYSEFETVKPGLESMRAAGIQFRDFAAQGPYIAQSRNALINGELSQAIRQEVGTEYSHYLFIDSDIGFTAGHVEALLAMTADVACCPYLRHVSKTEYHTWLFSEPGLISHRFTAATKGIQKVDGCGGGFMLVKTPVFNRIPYPWFRYGLLEKDGCAEIIGEDICFSMAVNAANINIFCNFDFPVFHKPRLVDYKTEG